MTEARPEETVGRIDVALAVAARSGRLLVRRRAAGLHMAGRWEFPGGKVAAGEDPQAAARRELLEEAGLEARVLEPLALVVHDYADRPLRIHAFLALEPAGDPVDDAAHGLAWSWKTLAELRDLDMPEANRGILRALRWRLTDE